MIPLVITLIILILGLSLCEAFAGWVGQKQGEKEEVERYAREVLAAQLSITKAAIENARREFEIRRALSEDRK